MRIFRRVIEQICNDLHQALLVAHDPCRSRGQFHAQVVLLRQQKWRHLFDCIIDDLPDVERDNVEFYQSSRHARNVK